MRNGLIKLARKIEKETCVEKQIEIDFVIILNGNTDHCTHFAGVVYHKWLITIGLERIAPSKIVLLLSPCALESQYTNTAFFVSWNVQLCVLFLQLSPALLYQPYIPICIRNTCSKQPHTGPNIYNNRTWKKLKIPSDQYVVYGDFTVEMWIIRMKE